MAPKPEQPISTERKMNVSQTLNGLTTRAEEPGVPTTPPTKAGKEIFKQGIALLIGVGDCDYTPWSLPVTATDAKALSSVLLDPQRCGYLRDHVTVLSGKTATREEILATLEAMSRQVSTMEDSTAVIFYSGHGWQDNDGRYYLIPSDTKPYDLTNTALRAEDFSQVLSRIRPARLLVILDTCHAAGMAEAKSVLPPGFHLKAPPEDIAPILGKGSGRVVLCSCRDNEKSWILRDGRLSIFTHHLIEAFEGKGSRGKVENVSVLSLMTYVSEAVPKTAKAQSQKQTPFYKLESDDFPVAAIQHTENLKDIIDRDNKQLLERDDIINIKLIGRDNIADHGHVEGDLIIGSTINPSLKRSK